MKTVPELRGKFVDVAKKGLTKIADFDKPSVAEQEKKSEDFRSGSKLWR